jgi:hypothetical protein
MSKEKRKIAIPTGASSDILSQLEPVAADAGETQELWAQGVGNVKIASIDPLAVIGGALRSFTHEFLLAFQRRYRRVVDRGSQVEMPVLVGVED